MCGLVGIVGNTDVATDIYDALRSTRPYKKGFSHKKTVGILTDGDDRIDPLGHFDPKLIRLFQDNHLEFAQIWDRLKDG